MSTHYSSAFNAQAMIKWAHGESLKIKQYAVNNDLHPILVYIGMSGVAHASYLAQALVKEKVNFMQIYVRKKNEKSHSTHRIEHNIYDFVDLNIEDGVLLNRNNCFIVFVDDFVDQFNSFFYAMDQVIKASPSMENFKEINIMFSLYSYGRMKNYEESSDTVLNEPQSFDEIINSNTYIKKLLDRWVE